jgi:formate hydrogenlyase subunit 3/multisubunit Na+/H+ antiporter MnhD subunit
MNLFELPYVGAWAMTPQFMLSCVAGFLGLAVFGTALGRHRVASPIVYLSCALVSAMLLANALGALLMAAPAQSTWLAMGLPWIGAHFRLDALSAAFLAIVNLGGSVASLYAVGYGRHETAPQRVLPFFPAFLAGMNLVVLADDAFTFLVSWEFMSLVSWALVLTHHREPENARAGYIYILMASFGTLALLLAFGLLAGPEGGYAFASMRAHPPAPTIAAAALGLVLLGAGSKAGLVPLHVWLPLAHPAAPSHVSALLSGVMTKVAVYAFIRFAFDLLGPPQWWWGEIVLSVGGVTAVLGVLFALFQNDIKRALAYSTLENVGIVFVGLGLALAFQANQLPAAAAVAFTAAVFHALNHTIFKSLLFFGAGAVLSATGTRDMGRVGGLIHRMPWTAGMFLTGAGAICALPPLNGFASEWLVLQSILLSPQLPQWALKLLIPAIGGLLALAAALAAACFVRLFGITFLGRPRSPEAAHAREADPWSLFSMSALAALCFILGVLPGAAIDAIGPVVEAAVGARMPAQLTMPWLSIVPIAESRSSYNGLLVFGFITVSTLLVVLAIHRFASRNLRRVPAWDCGYPDSNPATQYTAESFAQPLRRVFGTRLLQAREVVHMPLPGDQSPARLTVELRDLIWEGLYAPISSAVGYVADHLNRLQFLTIRKYLGLVFFALVSLLLVLAIWG